MARLAIAQISHDGKIYFSIAHVAIISGYHRERIRQLIAENKLPAERIGSAWFVAESDAVKFIQKKGSASAPVLAPMSLPQPSRSANDRLPLLHSFMCGVICAALLAVGVANRNFVFSKLHSLKKSSPP